MAAETQPLLVNQVNGEYDIHFRSINPLNSQKCHWEGFLEQNKTEVKIKFSDGTIRDYKMYLELEKTKICWKVFTSSVIATFHEQNIGVNQTAEGEGLEFELSKGLTFTLQRERELQKLIINSKHSAIGNRELLAEDNASKGEICLYGTGVVGLGALACLCSPLIAACAILYCALNDCDN
ncbi:hypothetical protein D5018_17330 [Parashewanella curva]|uniref:Uncharacterized protein n=1 Tax=Parashewanella curva TaxID=2338552 RepID=A0A3L8PSR2_9GAMM|nr:hypothetical protein [Parashewanella curva]RLV58441.1 hypothetical protein D5018_17330 [Parashewanella curva]